MKHKKDYHWIKKNDNRQGVLLKLKQPMTALQLSKLTALTLDHCSVIIKEFAVQKILYCINPTAKRSRLYWLTPKGIKYQNKLRDEKGIRHPNTNIPKMNWDLYGWTCYNNRSAVIKALNEPMQPPKIKKRAYLKDSKLKMTANNVRDIIRLFLSKNIVKSVKLRKKAHPRYELTETGKRMRELLLKAEH